MKKSLSAFGAATILVVISIFSSGCNLLKTDKCKEKSESHWDWDDSMPILAASGTDCGSKSNPPLKPEAPSFDVSILLGHWHVGAQAYDDVTQQTQAILPADSLGRIFTRTDLGASSVELHLIKFTKDKIEICRGVAGSVPKCVNHDYFVSAAHIISKRTSATLFRFAKQIDGDLALEDELGRGYRFSNVSESTYLQLKAQLTTMDWMYNSQTTQRNSLAITSLSPIYGDKEVVLTNVTAKCFQWNSGGLIVELRGSTAEGGFAQDFIIHPDLQSRVAKSTYTNLSIGLKRRGTPGGGSPVLGSYELLFDNQLHSGSNTLSPSGECSGLVRKDAKSIGGVIECRGISSIEFVAGLRGAKPNDRGNMKASWSCPLTWLH